MPHLPVPLINVVAFSGHTLVAAPLPCMAEVAPKTLASMPTRHPTPGFHRPDGGHIAVTWRNKFWNLYPRFIGVHIDTCDHENWDPMMGTFVFADENWRFCLPANSQIHSAVLGNDAKAPLTNPHTNSARMLRHVTQEARAPERGLFNSVGTGPRRHPQTEYCFFSCPMLVVFRIGLPT